MEKIEVHNAWTVYGLDIDGEEADQPIAEASRPQDWGDPRWHYEKFKFEWFTKDAHYINNVHCWTDLKREQWQYPMLFAQFIVQILMPGLPAEWCGKEYLRMDDFWAKSWGKRPPVYSKEDEF